MSPALAAYNYEGALYTVSSTRPVLNVEEKKLVSLSKEVTPANATAGQKIKVTLAVKDLSDVPLQLILLDGAKNFTVDLGQGEEKSVSYDAKAGPSTADVASATYTFESQQFTTFSSPPKFSLAEGGGAGASQQANETGKESGSAGEEGKKGGIFNFIVNILVKILTWKRGG